MADVHSPSEAKVIEVLWRRSAELDVTPCWPVVRPGTGQCFFLGAELKRRGLYMVDPEKSNRAKAAGVMENQRQMTDQQLGALAERPVSPFPGQPT